MRHYSHLSMNEREKIGIHHAKGVSDRKIAVMLGRSPSTISRELRRITGKADAYSGWQAQQDYRCKREKSRRRRKLSSDPVLCKRVQALLEKDFSPHQVAGRLALEGSGEISFNTIYRGLERGELPQALKKRLRIQGRPYRKGHGGRTGKLPIGHTIQERPPAANARAEVGHWESDTVLGTHNTGAVATHVDRKSRYLIALKLTARTADLFAMATIAAFKRVPQGKRKSFTVDHGKEFAKYREIEEALGITVYFADVGNPGQRGTNENTNGLLRQYLPKRSSFKNLTQPALDVLVCRLNLRPRRCLGWKTPFEVFHQKVLHLT